MTIKPSNNGHPSGITFNPNDGVPRMTQWHVTALERFGDEICTHRHDCPLPHGKIGEVHALVGAIVSREAMVISASEISDLRYAAQNQPAEVFERLALEAFDSWLARPSTEEVSR